MRLILAFIQNDTMRPYMPHAVRAKTLSLFLKFSLLLQRAISLLTIAELTIYRPRNEH